MTRWADSAPRRAGAAAEDAVGAQLGRVLNSEAFASAERSRKFLQFVVNETLEGRGGNIKETVVAVAVFGRTPSFDPQSDSIVRVEARLLRSRLRDYYATEGLFDAILIEIPKGGYVPRFTSRAEPSRPRRRRRGWIAAGVVGVAALAGLAFVLANQRAGKSVAVLPVTNLSGPESELLARGMTEDLTTELARLSGLRVTAPRATARLQTAAADPREAGRQLGVDAVLQSSLRLEDRRLRFTARLIDVHSGYHLWSESYDREAANSLTVESELVDLAAAGVARTLKSGGATMSARHKPSAEALDLFWRARYLRRQGTAEDWRKAADLLEAAVRIDPHYLQARSALVSTLASRMFHAGAGFGQLAERTRAAAIKTLEFDDRDPNALLALAQLAWINDRNWTEAERRFRLVTQLNPEFVAGHGWFSTALAARARFDEALAQLASATRLDPFAYLVSNDEATILYCARRYDQAAARARKTIELEPDFVFAHVILGACDSARGRYAEAVRAFRLVEEQAPVTVQGRLGHALARAGHRDEARALLPILEADSVSNNSQVQAAFVRVGLGDAEGALGNLEAAFARRETDLNYMAVEPVLDPLHGAPRFEALKARLGL
jgi:serine/threonine-protein kinase